jgi:hypothetical protein
MKPKRWISDAVLIIVIVASALALLAFNLPTMFDQQTSPDCALC